MRKRIIAGLAAVGLTFSMLVLASPASAAPPPGVAQVAFGDSEAAGTGNLLYVDRSCLRSRVSYPLLLKATSYACASATTTDVLSQIGTAVAAKKLGHATRLVTVTAGVNDLGWQSVLQICYSQGDVACQAALAQAATQLPAVGERLGQAVAAIRQAAPNATILVTGYPRLFGQISKPCTVGWLQGAKIVVSANQAALANAGVNGLNAVISGVVAGFNAGNDSKVAFVDVATLFTGRGLCDTKPRWIYGIIGVPVVSNASLHVNAAGQLAIAAAVWRQR